MNIDLRKVRFNIAQEFLIPLQWQRGMQATLHQDLIAPQRNSLFNFCEDETTVEEIPFSVLRRPIKSAEITDGCADIGVVDVAIDVVCAIGLRMHASCDGIRCSADSG